jgi:gamma-tubulin complex component 2
MTEGMELNSTKWLMQVVNVSGVNQEGAEAEKQQVSAVHSTDEDNLKMAQR